MTVSSGKQNSNEVERMSIFGDNADLHVGVAQMGQKEKKVGLSEGATIGDAIKAAELNPEQFNITVNDLKAGLDEIAKDGDLIVLTPNLQGGCL